MKLPENGVRRRILTPDDDSGAQYFFGYYDLLSYDADDRRHLFHRVNVDFCGGLPTEHDAAELGYIDLETGEIVDLTTGQTFAAEPFPPFMLELIAAGGLAKYFSNR